MISEPIDDKVERVERLPLSSKAWRALGSVSTHYSHYPHGESNSGMQTENLLSEPLDDMGINWPGFHRVKLSQALGDFC